MYIYMLRLLLVALALPGSRSWGLCNDEDVSCANWAKAGECEKSHVKKQCPHSCGVCDHHCKDLHEGCLAWADAGECESSPDYMLKNCPVTCGVCRVKCYDEDASCGAWARQGECAKNPSLLSTCPVSCGTCTDLCLDKKESCPQWAANGDCGTNEGYMLKECPRSCELCREEHHQVSSHPVAGGARELTQTVACADVNRKQCVIWGEQLCESNPGAMLRDCPHTCGVCTLACEDKYKDCPNWAVGKDGGKPRQGCDDDAGFMRVNCPHSCGVCRDLEPPPPSGKDEM